MKIALVTRSLPCHIDGGLEYHTIGLAQGLKDAGHQVTLITTQLPDNYRGVQYELDVVFLKNTIPGKYSYNFFWELRNYLVTRHDLDIIHTQGFSGLALALYPLKIPMVSTIHGTLTSETSLNYQTSLSDIWAYRKRIILTPLYHQLIKKSDGLIFDSNYSRDEVFNDQNFNFPKSKVIYLGIDINRFQPMDRKDVNEHLKMDEMFTIFTVGRITKTKGIQVLLEAAQSLSHLPIRWIIGGDGPYRDYYQNMANEKNLSNVVFTGRLKLEELPYFYNASDIFVFPDMTSPAFGLVAVEAMSCGVPVIASRAGALPEVIPSDSGFLFDRGDSKALSWLVNYLYENPTLRTDLALNARIHSQRKYNQDRMVQETIGFYERVLSGETL